jgi:hypothetical protein
MQKLNGNTQIDRVAEGGAILASVFSTSVEEKVYA